MNTERTPVVTDLPVGLDVVKDLARVDYDDDDAGLSMMIRAAALDVEAMTGLALLTTTVVVTTDDTCSAVIALGVGPVLPEAVATVATLNDDGTTTAVATGFWLEAGRYPRLHLTDTTITLPLVIT